MKLREALSPEFVLSHAGATLRRFPAVIVASSAAGAALDLMIRSKSSPSFEVLAAFLSFVLAIALFVAATLLGERLSTRRVWARGAAYLTALLIPLAYFGVAYNSEVSSTYFRFAQLLLAAHLLVAFVPFFGRDEKTAFWHFNKTLFLRFFLSLLYSGVLVGGIMLIYVSLTYLFGVEISSDAYKYTWLFCTFMFHPIHFLAGVPRDFEELEMRQDYPNGLKVFTQYLLVPLVSIYMTILAAYFLKIVVGWTWPRGMVSWMVTSLAGAGIFTLLLLDPLTRRGDSSWTRTYTRIFYAVLIPLEALLLAAVWRRVSEYGFTESRYLLLVFGAWCLGVSIYFSLSRSRDIRRVPVTLFLITLLAAFGPWGAYGVSLRSQKSRLEVLLERSGALVEGKLRSEHAEISLKDHTQILSIFDYLLKRHGPEPLEPWAAAGSLRLANSEKGEGRSLSRYKEEEHARREFFEQAGINPQRVFDSDSATSRPRRRFAHRRSTDAQLYDIQGFKHMASFSLNDKKTHSIVGSDYSIARSKDEKNLIVKRAGQVVADIPFDEIFVRLKTKPRDDYFLEGDEQMFPLSSDKFRAVLFVRELMGTSGTGKQSGDLQVEDLEGLIFFNP
jgi:hypothetical protein